MRRLLFVIAFCLVCTVATAQNLWVCSSNGKVEINSGAGWKVPVEFQKLSPADSLRFAPNSSLSILDRKNERVFSVQRRGVCVVADVVNDAPRQNNKQQKGLFSYLWDSLRGRTADSEFRGAAGVVYRDNDINTALAGAVLRGDNSLPVYFELVDAETGRVLEGKAMAGDYANVLVRNNSSVDLFVNLLDFDCEGSISVCLPVTSATVLAKLLIPAGVTVLLDSLPILFGEPVGTDTLVLIACTDPFDPEAVANSLRDGNATDREIQAAVVKMKVAVLGRQ